MNTNIKSAVCLVADAKEALNQLTTSYKTTSKGPIVQESGPWWKSLKESAAKNNNTVAKMIADTSIPMNYYSTLKIIEDSV